MKKLSILKRIFVLFCCTVLLSSSIFASYSMTVYASDDYDIIDAAQDILNICIVIGGIIFAPATDGFSILITTRNILGLRDSIEGLRDYITDNGDGTYTIDPALVQAAMDAAEQLEAQGFTDTDITKQKKGNYELRVSAFDRQFMCSKHNAVESCTITDTTTVKSGLFACSVQGPDQYGRYTVYVHNSLNASYFDEKCKYKFTCGYESINYHLDSLSGHSYGANVPIFTDEESAKSYITKGTGYKNAENYREKPIFRRHSSYTPTYAGGSITVNRTVVQNIASKIAEVDADDTKTDDEKIEILQKYILSGGTSDVGGDGSGGGGDKDYDDNKDLPAGTDLADTNSWLKKIYLKVCQIFDKMNTAVGDAEDAAIAKIQESLDEIIVQLKKIKRWTAVDTVVDGVDAIADWLDLIRGVLKDAKEGAGSAVATIASAVGDSVDTMSKKFPFSIPWDILFFVSVLSAEPQVPHFEIPFNIELSMLDITIDYTMELDFTQLQWLSDLSRLLLSMTYAVGLMRMTFGVTSAGKEE